MERVKKGEKYWYITSYCEVEIAYETEDDVDFLRFKANNYFPANKYTPKMVDEIARKIRAVLKGACVIEMPSEEEMLNSLPSDWSAEQYMSGVGIGWHRCYNWLKSKIVK